MKTCLFSSCYLEGTDAFGGARLARHHKYVNYYRPLKDVLGFDHFFFSDNGSSPEKLKLIEGNDVTLFRNTPSLVRGTNGGEDYPYIWRAFYDIRKIIEGGQYKKIVCIDTDAFILSKKLADYVKDLNTGWTAFKVQKYGFPSAEFFILCEDSFKAYMEFTSGHFLDNNGKVMERVLPFTIINDAFNVDRYGETEGKQPDESIDLFGQCRVETEVSFET